jgi:pimeloyl-ACP methyl ester carboxylesterase
MSTLIADKLVHRDHSITSSVQSGLRLKVRERFSESLGEAASHRVPLLMVHGATVSSLLWDHPIADWSWMNRFALDGFHVYALDLRGYGGSTRLPELECPNPQDFPPYARASDVQQDIEDAVSFICQRHQIGQIDLLGGSWGSITCGMFASTRRAQMLRRLVLYAPIYDEGHTKTSWWHGAVDPSNHDQVNPRLGAYRWVTRQSLISRWDDEIPLKDKSAWRTTEVFDTLFNACLDEDPAARARDPHAFRAPNGTLVDLFGAYTGRPVFEAQKISVPTLLIRGDHDQTSSRVGTLKLFDELGAKQKVYVEVGNGAHFVILEKQAPKVHQAVSAFLAEPD